MITLKKPLNYEARSSYNMLIKAEDQGIPSLSSTANVLITINDIQDQKPFFLNGPYSISIPENIPPVSNFFNHSSEDFNSSFQKKILLYIFFSPCREHQFLKSKSEMVILEFQEKSI